MKKFSAYLILPLFVFAFALNAYSALIGVTDPFGSSVGGAAAIIAPPSDVLDDIVTNRGMQGFDEAQAVLTGGLTTDSGVIAAGTWVDSHMIFLNSDGGTRITHYSVTWTFARPILGVMSDSGGTLEAASTAELGNPATNYTVLFPGSGEAAPFNLRGLEGMGNPASSDGYSISGDELTVGMGVTEPGDWIRVVTEGVPIPPSILLLGSALICLAGIRRKSKK